MKRRTDSILTCLKVFWIDAQQFRSWINKSAFIETSSFGTGAFTAAGLVLSKEFSRNI